MRCPSCGDLIRSAAGVGGPRRCGACGRTLAEDTIDLVPRHEVVEQDLFQRSRRIAHDALDWARLLGSIIDLDVTSASIATQAERLARLAGRDEEVLAEARAVALDEKLPESAAAAVLLSEALRRSVPVRT